MRNKVFWFRLVTRIVPRVPLWLNYAFAIVAGNITWLIASPQRHRVRANLAHISSLAANPARLNRVTRLAFVHLFLNYIDLFFQPQPPYIDQGYEFIIDGIPEFRAAFDEGKGVILVTLHVGTFEAAKCRLRDEISGRIIVPVERVEPPEYFDFLCELRGRSGLDFLPVDSSDTLRTMITTLKEKGAVLIASDRDVLHTGPIMPFFGAPAQFPTGVIALARATGSPIVWINAVRHEYRRFHATLRRLPIEVNKKTRTDAEIAHALQPFVRQLESTVSAYPEQWLASFVSDIWQPTDMSLFSSVTDESGNAS
jgi:lauroyl/myristoyl acyltransferase